jgi:hypothetical protein
MEKLTTSQVAKRLRVAQVTVNVWCLQGRFPHATKEDTPRGPVWVIPESDLTDFEKPTIGRPPSEKLKPVKRAAKKRKKR